MAEGRRAQSARLLSAPFVTAVLILALTAVGLPPITRHLQVAMTKLPIELRQPLARLDKSALRPFAFREAIILEDSIVNSLGTEEYIDWILEDESPGENPLPFARVSVTYYTGKPDAVPHTPDVCMRGAGYVPTRKENTTVHIPELGEDADVPIRVLDFIKSDIFDNEHITVAYTFHCNGEFAGTREGVRRAVNRPLDKYAYYSKVEVSCFDPSQARSRFATREDSMEATRKVLAVVLPLLVENHWPDWEAATRADVESSPAS